MSERKLSETELTAAAEKLREAIEWHQLPKLADIFKARPRINIYWHELVRLVGMANRELEASRDALEKDLAWNAEAFALQGERLVGVVAERDRLREALGRIVNCPGPRQEFHRIARAALSNLGATPQATTGPTTHTPPEGRVQDEKNAGPGSPVVASGAPRPVGEPGERRREVLEGKVTWGENTSAGGFYMVGGFSVDAVLVELEGKMVRVVVETLPDEPPK